MIEGLLVAAAITVRQLQGIAFGAGPGSFTGLRIACGIAQGLALSAGLVVTPVATLECLAEASGAQRVISALDARMGELYFAAYERDRGGWRTVLAPVLCQASTAPVLPGAWVGCGGGFAVHGDVLRQRYGNQLEALQPDLIPHAREVATIGARMLARGEGVDPAAAAPVYVRDKVALSVGERAARKARGGAGAA